MNGPVRYLFRYIQRTFFLSAACMAGVMLVGARSVVSAGR